MPSTPSLLVRIYDHSQIHERNDGGELSVLTSSLWLTPGCIQHGQLTSSGRQAVMDSTSNGRQAVMDSTSN